MEVAYSGQELEMSAALEALMKYVEGRASAIILMGKGKAEAGKRASEKIINTRLFVSKKVN
jgi:hypothetical protein